MEAALRHHTTKLFGSQLHYWITGPADGPVIVMVHGFRGTHHGLFDVMAQLPGYCIVIPDLPGFGDSTPMTQLPHTIEGYAQLMLALMHELKLGPVILLGHSLGTTIAAEMVARQPRAASKLILINPIAEHPLKGMGALKMAPGVLYHWLAGSILPEALGEKVLRNKLLFLVGSAAMTKTKDKVLRQKIHNSHLTYMSRFHDRHTLLEAYQTSINNTVTTRASKILIPTLLIAGKIDAIAPIKGQRMLVKALAKGQLVEIDQVGHIIHFEKAKEAGAAINKFLA